MPIDAETLIHSARLVSGGRVTEGGWIVLRNGTIAATGDSGTLPEWSGRGEQDGARVIDAAGCWLTPGFIDIHCHGAGGGSFAQGSEDMQTALAVHRSHGTTRSALSISTAPMAALEDQLRMVAAATRADPLILGAHLEGPFLEHEHRGAHDPELLLAFDPAAVQRVLAAGEGAIVQVTLAPEQPGGMDALRTFVSEGVAVALGHSGATYEQALAAFDAGATILTHAFNGMRGVHHRAPGPVAAAFRTPSVTLEIINDGAHVHPEVVRTAFAAAPGRVALITDAMAAAGSGDGDYELASRRVIVRDGVAMLEDGSSLAGSTLTLDVALRRAVQTVGVQVEIAVRALTETPARAIGRERDLGKLEAGFAADAVLLDENFTVIEVWAAGERLDER